MAQPRGYPQKKPKPWFCPRCDDSGARDRCTGFWRTQVRDAQGKKPVVHKKPGLLLLRLCIYRKHKKKTGENFCAPVQGFGWGPEFCWRAPAGCAQKWAKGDRKRRGVAGWVQQVRPKVPERTLSSRAQAPSDEKKPQAMAAVGGVDGEPSAPSGVD